MSSVSIALVVCSMVVIVALSICISCVKYFTSDNKRRLLTLEEKYSNLSILMERKENECNTIMKSKEEECKRMSEIISSLMEKQSRIDANIVTK